MKMASSSAPPTTSGTRKRAIKNKLDSAILKKARVALGLPSEGQDDDNEKQQEPSLKWRKPRHNTEEGKVYIKNKEKRKQLEEETQVNKSTKNPAGKVDKKGKRKRKAKKKAKVSVELTKNPDGEKRHQMEAISYLQLWATNRDHWKFEKRKQTWLLKNCLNETQIDEKRFELLLEYMASVKGASRQATVTEMESAVTKFEMLSSKRGSEVGEKDSDKSNNVMITQSQYDRARQIIQMLA